VHAHFDLLGNNGAELAQHRARLAYHAAPVVLALVPGGRHAEERARVAGAERAHDYVVQPRRVLHRDQAIGFQVDAPLGAGALAVDEQALPEIRVHPGMCDDARAALWKLGIELLHAPAQLLGRYHAFRLEQLLHGAAHDLVLRRRTVVERAVARMVVIVMFHAASSQCS